MPGPLLAGSEAAVKPCALLYPCCAPLYRRLGEAGSEWRRALAQAAAVCGATSMQAAACHMGLGNTLAMQGAHALPEAEQHLRKALAIRQDQLGGWLGQLGVWSLAHQPPSACAAMPSATAVFAYVCVGPHNRH